MSALSTELSKGDVFSIRNSQGLFVGVHHYSWLFQLLECSHRQLRTESELKTGCKNDPKSTTWNSIKKCVKCYPWRAEICAEKQQEEELQPRSSTETSPHALSHSSNHKTMECPELESTSKTKSMTHELNRTQQAQLLPKKYFSVLGEMKSRAYIYMPAKPIFDLINIDLVGLVVNSDCLTTKKKKGKIKRSNRRNN